MLAPVESPDAGQTLAELACTASLELGPNQTLAHLAVQALGQGATPLKSLGGDGDEWGALLSSLATLYRLGAEVDWQGFDRDYPRRRILLPTYPFQRRRCWLDASEIRPSPGPFSTGGQ